MSSVDDVADRSMSAKMLVDLRELQDSTLVAASKAEGFRVQTNDLAARIKIVDTEWKEARDALSTIADLVTRTTPLSPSEQKLVGNKDRFEARKLAKSEEHTELSKDHAKALKAMERHDLESSDTTRSFKSKLEWCASYLSEDQLASLNEEIKPRSPQHCSIERMEVDPTPNPTPTTPVEKADDGLLIPSFRTKDTNFRPPELVVKDLATLLQFPPALEVQSKIFSLLFIITPPFIYYRRKRLFRSWQISKRVFSVRLNPRWSHLRNESILYELTWSFIKRI